MEAMEEKLLALLGHAPTQGQWRAIHALVRLLATEKPRATLVLKGYAGTGKTTLVGALVKALAQERRPVVLLAPTGRAAKVLSAYAGASASTIHRRIYRARGEEGDDRTALAVAPNRDRGALFVVDEASMIGKSSGAFERDLLADLFEHVFSDPANKLLLIEKFIYAKNRIRNLNAAGTNYVWYVSDAVYTFIETYMVDKSNVHVTRQDIMGKPPQLYLSGIAVKKLDVMREDEAAIS